MDRKRYGERANILQSLMHDSTRIKKQNEKVKRFGFV